MASKPGALARELSAAGSAPPAGAPLAGFTPSLPPDPASEVEIEQLRYQLRAAQHQLTQESDRLAGLQRAHERARAKRGAALEALALAEAMVTHAKQFGRRNLALAYVNHEPHTGPTPEIAAFEYERRAGQLRDADTLVSALAEEIGLCEGALNGHRRARDDAAGALVSRSGEFLCLFARLQQAFAEIRTCRVAIREIARLVTLESRLTTLAAIDQPITAERFVGYPVNEELVGGWSAAVRCLLSDADAALPDSTGALGRHGLDEVRDGGAAQPARPRAPGGGLTPSPPRPHPA